MAVAEAARVAFDASMEPTSSRSCEGASVGVSPSARTPGVGAEVDTCAWRSARAGVAREHRHQCGVAARAMPTPGDNVDRCRCLRWVAALSGDTRSTTQRTLLGDGVGVGAGCGRSRGGRKGSGSSGARWAPVWAPRSRAPWSRRAACRWRTTWVPGCPGGRAARRGVEGAASWVERTPQPAWDPSSRCAAWC